MKSIFLLVGLTSIQVAGQSLATKIECKKIPFSEFSVSYTTQDEKGDPMVLIEAMTITLNSKRCLDEGFTVNLPFENKKEMTKPGWYIWNPVKKNWKKYETPRLVKSSFSGRSGYTVTVKCPGVYAFFEHPISNEKGIELSLKNSSEIIEAEVVQNSPAVRVLVIPSRKTNSIIIPTCDLQFDATIKIRSKEKGGIKENSYLIGSLCDLSEGPNSEGYRLVRIKSNENNSLTIHP